MGHVEADRSDGVGLTGRRCSSARTSCTPATTPTRPRVIDEEVERILREEEDRTRKVLTEYRPDSKPSHAPLLERETLDGAEVGRLIDEAMGRNVRRAPRMVTRADGTEVEATETEEADELIEDAGADVFAPLPD